MKTRATEKPFIDGLLSEEIRRLVAKAIEKRSMIEVVDCVAKVRAVYPNCGLSKRQITDEIMTAAAAAGVTLAFGLAEPEPQQEERVGPESA